MQRTIIRSSIPNDIHWKAEHKHRDGAFILSHPKTVGEFIGRTRDSMRLSFWASSEIKAGRRPFVVRTKSGRVAPLSFDWPREISMEAILKTPGIDTAINEKLHQHPFGVAFTITPCAPSISVQ